VTSNLVGRVYQHKLGAVEGFTKKYGVNSLVYFEMHDSIEAAILRENQMKKWRRAWKIRLIEERNPNWIDLYSQIAMQ
jgi:putative endonuclease